MGTVRGGNTGKQGQRTGSGQGGGWPRGTGARGRDRAFSHGGAGSHESLFKIHHLVHAHVVAEEVGFSGLHDYLHHQPQPVFTTFKTNPKKKNKQTNKRGKKQTNERNIGLPIFTTTPHPCHCVSRVSLQVSECCQGRRQPSSAISEASNQKRHVYTVQQDKERRAEREGKRVSQHMDLLHS